ncbi:MAG: BlaI family penicillinase repressor [Verrucomicrobiales bacterium]|jgi:BlaI family penicillinase repressor
MCKKNIELPHISDAEWRVMEVFWGRESGEATANEVVAALEGEARWKPKTVHTLLRRLAGKGALVTRKRGREYVYRQMFTSEESRLAESRTFLNKVFNGKVAPLVAAFVEREEVTADEIAELKRILEEARR